jgi:hypothetical protein
MSVLDQPEIPNQGKIHVGSVVTQRRPEEVAVNITKEEFLTLCEGDTSGSKGKRDFNRGICWAAILALVGLLASTDWGTFVQRKHVWPFWACGMLFLLAVGIFGMAWFKDQERLTVMESTGCPHSRLVARLDAQFSSIIKQNQAAAVEDYKAVLIARTNKVLTTSGIAGGWGLNPYADRLLYRINRKDGGGVLEIVVPTNTPLDSVEEVVKKQLPK